MSHGLVIPDANKSPYPLQEPPHAPQQTANPVKKANKADKANKSDKSAKSGGQPRSAAALNGKIVLGTALGLGALALVATIFEQRSKAAKPKSRKSRKN